jgi:hypothetical protein
VFTDQAQNYSSVQIANKLHEYFETRDKARALRLEIIQIAVDLGQNQKDAASGSASADYLDGYLAGAGVITSARLSV